MIYNFLQRGIFKATRELALVSVKKTAFFSPDRKIVSFTFDDFPISAVDNGAHILEKNKAYGTFYASFGLCGEIRPVGEISKLSEMFALEQKGHELGCHTFSHLSCHFKSPSIIRTDCENNQKIAHKKADIHLQSFAYPHGKIDPLSKYVISKMYSSARTIEPGINVNKIDLCALRSIELSDNYGFTNISKWLSKLDNYGGWLIFFTHDVCKTPSQFGCSIDLFEKIVNMCLHKGYKILPVKEVVELYCSFRNSNN